MTSSRGAADDGIQSEIDRIQRSQAVEPISVPTEESSIPPTSVRGEAGSHADVPPELRDLPQPQDELDVRSSAVAYGLVTAVMVGAMLYVASNSHDKVLALALAIVVAAIGGTWALGCARRGIRCEPDGLHYRKWRPRERVIPWHDVDGATVTEHIRPEGRYSWATYYDLKVFLRRGALRFPGAKDPGPASRAALTIMEFQRHYDDGVRAEAARQHRERARRPTASTSPW